ncbi:MAG: hypothetical protein H6813_02460 [Phycisphaeraceae bacterium]|nr:hypothetical protein [Phycisphaeraceae bacterium]
MTRKYAIQRLIAALCLLTFGLGQSVVGQIAVHCEDTQGRISVELGCSKLVDESCAAACDSVESDIQDQGEHEDVGHTPHPCKDTPIGELSYYTTKLVPKSSSGNTVHFKDLASLIVQRMAHGVLFEQRFTAHMGASVKPPDTVARLRTVILNV